MKYIFGLILMCFAMTSYIRLLIFVYLLVGHTSFGSAQTAVTNHNIKFSGPGISHAHGPRLPHGDYVFSSGDSSRMFTIESVPGFSVYKLKVVNPRSELKTYMTDIWFELSWNETDRVYRAEKKLRSIMLCYWNYKIDVRIDGSNRVYVREWTPDKIEFTTDHIGSDCPVSSEGWRYFDKHAEYMGFDFRTFAENLLLSPDAGLAEEGKMHLAAIDGNFEQIEAYRLTKGRLPQPIPELHSSILYVAGREERCSFLTRLLQKYPGELAPLITTLNRYTTSFIDFASSGKKCSDAEKRTLASAFLAAEEFSKVATVDNIFVTVGFLDNLNAFQAIYRDAVDQNNNSDDPKVIQAFNFDVFRTLLRIRTIYEKGSEDSSLKFLGAFLDSKPRLDIKMSDRLFASWVLHENLPVSQKTFFDVVDANEALEPGHVKTKLSSTLIASIGTARSDLIEELEKRNMSIVETEKTGTLFSSSISTYIYNTEKFDAKFVEYLLAKGATKNPDLGHSPLDAMVDRYKEKKFEHERPYLVESAKWMMQLGFELKRYDEVPW